MIRIAQRSEATTAASRRLLVAAEDLGRWMRRSGAALAWWAGERVQEIDTGRAPRRAR